MPGQMAMSSGWLPINRLPEGADNGAAGPTPSCFGASELIALTAMATASKSGSPRVHDACLRILSMVWHLNCGCACGVNRLRAKDF